jgi:hypothetical protein
MILVLEGIIIKMVLCIEDVFMREDSTKAFTKGNIYKCYRTKLKHMYDYKRVVCAKNDMNQRHVIKELDSDRLDEFYNTSFKEVVE